MAWFGARGPHDRLRIPDPEHDLAGNGLKSASRGPESMDDRPAVEVRFPPASEPGEVRGILHRPRGPTLAGIVVTHGRSSDMRNRLVKRIAEAAADAGLVAVRMDFRYIPGEGRDATHLR